MNAFDACRLIEERGMPAITRFLRTQAHDGMFVLNSKGELAEQLQKTVGDALLNDRTGRLLAIEMKIEQRFTGNFFFETWSNLSRFKRGWLDHLQCHALLYHFLETRDLYSIPFEKLKRWCFHPNSADQNSNPGNLHRFKERLQRKTQQMNDTWGVCVPIQVIRAEVGFRQYVLSESGDFVRKEDAIAPDSLFATAH